MADVAVGLIFWGGVVCCGLGIGWEFLSECPSTWGTGLVVWGFAALVAGGVLQIVLVLDEASRY